MVGTMVFVVISYNFYLVGDMLNRLIADRIKRVIVKSKLYLPLLALFICFFYYTGQVKELTCG